ncbi:NUDIX hydrolase [Pirellula staleyi DSM 6068]|uniref:GDP-mannose pyrophosphatase n=1 Tax=Pirellula staleyi (strain ATCC 27377 / DSM 6068 / ICPB 4128) TaxID=530564 RepID=D2QY42_PIRSD|nr:NUDIX hydrolase [Pirellula staleyi]ADB16256.1 NUDIX hydrolase [Pirellula staleyi DSM 6068]
MPSADEKLLLTTPKFRVVETTVTSPKGLTKARAVIRHPGAVVIVPMLDDFHVCMIRNFRVSVGKVLLELPAGTLEPPEPPHECAVRELIEETGYRCQKMQPLSSFFLSPGILDERMHLFVATGLSAGATAREEGEEIDNEILPLDDALELAMQGQIEDAKSIAGLFWVDRLRQAGKLSY